MVSSDTPVYDFEDKKAEGEAFEHVLDAAFGRMYHIESVTDWLQRHEVDRFFTSRCKLRRTHLVEYKADSKAAKTGNAFIELVSVDTQNRPGWAVCTWAQVLLYYIPPLAKVYVVSVFHLKNALPEWQKKYPTKKRVANSRNGRVRYNTVGIVIPLAELETVSYMIMNLT